MNFDLAHEFIQKQEGGFSDHKADAGGTTNHGISLRFLTNFAETKEGKNFLSSIDIPQPVTRNTIYSLTQAQAKALYKYEFWDKLNADSFPFSLAILLYDCAVNCGINQSVKIVQKAYNALNTTYGTPLREDGILGLQTKNSIITLDNPKFTEECIYQRELFYKKLINQKPSQAIFLKGWLNRCADLRTYIKYIEKKKKKASQQ